MPASVLPGPGAPSRPEALESPARINLRLAPKTSPAGQGLVEPDPSCLARLSMPVPALPNPGAPGGDRRLTHGFSTLLPRYDKGYRAACPSRPPVAESAVNEVVAKRMNKHQPMRWNRYTRPGQT